MPIFRIQRCPSKCKERRTKHNTLQGRTVVDAVVTRSHEDELDGVTQAGDDLAQLGHGLVVRPAGVDERQLHVDQEDCGRQPQDGQRREEDPPNEDIF